MIPVRSESAINAKELVITFNKAVDKDTVIAADGTLVDGVFGITRTPASATADQNVTANTAFGTLSADGKSLTVRAAGTEYFSGTYAVTVAKDVVETPKDEKFGAFATTLTVNDNVRPTVTGISYVDGVTAKVTFSESVKDLGTVSFKRVDGVAFNAATTLSLTNGNLSADGKSATISLASINAADRDKDIRLTLVGAKDYADNLITPNPVTVDFKYSTSDNVAPTVTNVVANKAGQMTITFSEKVRATGTNGLVGTFSVDGATGVNILTKGASANATIDATGTVVTVTDAALVSGLHNITLDGFSDLATNAGTAVTKVLDFKADTVDPSVVSTSVQKISGVEYLVITFDEEVTPVTGVALGGKVVKNYVETTNANFITTAAGNFTLHNAVNGKSNSVKLDISTLTDGQYTLDLDAGLVQDNAGRNSAAKTVTFTRTSNVDVNAPSVTAVSRVDNNTYTVTFNKQLEASSALNLANYSIEGTQVVGAIFTSNPTGGPSVVKLTLKDDSITLNGDRAISINNVKSVDGVAMNSYNSAVNLVENVKPVLQSAKLTSTETIELTYSEALDAATIEAALGVDFDVFVGSTKEDVASPAAVAHSGNKVTITLADALNATEYASTITVKPGSSYVVKDLNNNAAATFTSVTVSK